MYRISYLHIFLAAREHGLEGCDLPCLIGINIHIYTYIHIFFFFFLKTKNRLVWECFFLGGGFILHGSSMHPTHFVLHLPWPMNRRLACEG